MNLLRYFGSDMEGAGSPKLKVRNRAGMIVTVHCHPSRGAWWEQVSKILRDLGVSRAEFDTWSHNGRKARRP